jgi:beta-glucosidase
MAQFSRVLLKETKMIKSGIKINVVLIGVSLLGCSLDKADAKDLGFVQTTIYHDGWIDLNKNAKQDIYENPDQSIDMRIENLLSQMTLEEKTMQLVTLYGYGRVLKDPLPTEDWKHEIWKDGLGNIDEQHNGIGGGKEKFDWPPSLHTETINKTQRWFIEKTRLGIPVDFTNEGIRGICHTKATNFPSPLAMAATWDKELVFKTGQITGREGYSLGYTNVYSPILDVSQDPRWGRMVETYGECPFLVAELGIQQAKGLRSEKIGVTCKHFAVYGIPNGGRDGNARTDPKVAPREMEMIHLYPFERVIGEVGIQGVMSSYNDWDGIPISGNPLFLIDILRKGMGFRGYVVSDSDAVIFLTSKHKVEPDYKGAVRRFIESGGNVRTTFNAPDNFIKPLRESMADGSLPMGTVDDRVRDVLRVKFQLGLFDQPYRDPKQADMLVASKEHKQTSLKAARECLVLLKNSDQTLPLKKEKLNRILVTGPNADEIVVCQSRYGPAHGNVISVLEGIKDAFQGEVVYKKGCSHFSKNWPATEVLPLPFGEDEDNSIAEAVEEAKKCDVVIAVLGDSEKTVGESHSRTSLDLPPLQEHFIRQISQTGKPVIVVLLNGRAASINWVNEYCPAVILAWFGGEFMGQAVAEALFGDYNPGGKLPITFPRTVGQIPLNFPSKPGAMAGQGREADPNGSGVSRVIEPLYPFGYGLSYTTFQYSNLKVVPKQLTASETMTVTCDIANTGSVAGDEIVQLYVSDKVSSVTTYVKVLRGFERIHLLPGQTRTVQFVLSPRDHFWLIDQSQKRVVEPGAFEILVGASSTDIKLRQEIAIVGETATVGNSLLNP